MARIALLITSDKSLAKSAEDNLAQYGYNVEIAAEKLQVPAQLRRITPELIICDREMAGINPFLLCKTLKASAPVGFAMFVPRLQLGKTESEATSSGVDQLLSKPFNAKQFDEFIRSFIANRVNTTRADTLFLILLPDVIMRLVFVRLLSNLGARTLICDTIFEALVYLESDKQIVLVTTNENLEETLKLAPDSLKQIVTINGKELQDTKRESLQLYNIAYPSPTSTLAETLLQVTPQLIKEPEPCSALEFSADEISLLAARISAAVFEKLLLSPPLQYGNWTESAKLVRNEVLSTGRELEKLVRKRHPRTAEKQA